MQERTLPAASPTPPTIDSTPVRPKRIELWGGYECTVNRVGDAWYDQTPRSGHEHRVSDLALFAKLGMRSLRYPALWERISPDRADQRDFRWTDERLREMQRLGLNPILTLCHHGSGPHYTSLLSENFASGLAEHAGAVARRYPWVTDWTPVNEPLTTARFSALYGYWYPHTTDERLFWLALLNEIDATRLAMRAIRAVNPSARLIQTDDLGYCHATPPLQCEAQFQNERRWIGWDLLCGMVVPGHALWSRIAGFGLEDRLLAIADDPCPPDVIGINHYLSSERLLDHRVEQHPHRSIADRELGQCAGMPYVDVDAIRNLRPGVLGLPALLKQAWERYGLPIAVTECHNGATREEQVRWFVEVWDGAQVLRDGGMDLLAVTAWSLLGSFDWNRMVTRFAGHYEPGVFDVRSGHPRPTLLANVLQDLAEDRTPQAPALHVPGWWRRGSRFLDAQAGRGYELRPGDQALAHVRPLLIVGDDGLLTDLAVRACETRALHYVRCGNELSGCIQMVSPWAVLDTRDREGLAGPRRRVDRGHGARTSVARLCAEAGVPCVLFTSAYGPGLAAEGLSLSGVLVARTGPVFTPWDGRSRAVEVLESLDRGDTVRVDATSRWRAVYGPDLLDGVLDLLLDGVSGAVNFTPLEGWSEAQLVARMAEVAQARPEQVEVHGSADRSESLQSELSYLPPSETTLERFVRESRMARVDGELAVRRRQDEARLGEAIGSAP